MPTTRRAAILAAFSILASGCDDGPETGRRLIPVQGAGGLITYRFEDEMPEPTEAPVAPPVLVTGGGRGDEQAYREMVEFRRNREERTRRDLEERRDLQAEQDAMRALQREQARVEHQSRLERESREFHLGREQIARDRAAWLQQQVDEQTRTLRLMQQP